MSAEEKLKELGIELPGVPQPLGSYVPSVRTGNLVFISGMLPLKDGALVKTGKLGAAIDINEGAELARLAAINGLAVLRAEAGSLDNVTRCVKVSGSIASAIGFNDQPKVLNGASELMAEVFGKAGMHARAAIGVNELPMDSPVEIEFIFEVK
jgi:enamine deaminase RidA (YjgF/YER057c/UK114 family)